MKSGIVKDKFKPKEFIDLIAINYRRGELLLFLKLAGAVVGVVHAIDELSSAPKNPRSQIGFKPPVDPEEESDENDEYEL